MTMSQWPYRNDHIETTILQPRRIQDATQAALSSDDCKQEKSKTENQINFGYFSSFDPLT